MVVGATEVVAVAGLTTTVGEVEGVEDTAETAAVTTTIVAAVVTTTTIAGAMTTVVMTIGEEVDMAAATAEVMEETVEMDMDRLLPTMANSPHGFNISLLSRVDMEVLLLDGRPLHLQDGTVAVAAVTLAMIEDHRRNINNLLSNSPLGCRDIMEDLRHLDPTTTTH